MALPARRRPSWSAAPDPPRPRAIDLDAPIAPMNDDDSSRLLTWAPRLRRYARALTRSREDADDLVQDTLERALAKGSLWRSVADMRAWLFGIMHNLHVDAVRRPRLDLVPMDIDTPE